MTAPKITCSQYISRLWFLSSSSSLYMTSYWGLSWRFVDNKTTHCFHHETASATCKWGSFLSNHAFSVSLPGALGRWQADPLAAGPSRRTVKESEKTKAWHRIYSCGQEYRLGDWPVDEFLEAQPGREMMVSRGCRHGGEFNNVMGIYNWCWTYLGGA